MEARYTSVMRSTRSGNYYNVPLSPDLSAHGELSPPRGHGHGHSGFGSLSSSPATPFVIEESPVAAATAAWGTSTVRRITAPGGGKRDLNASLEGPMQVAGGSQSFRPSFAFDVNKLVATLNRSVSDSALSSSFGSSHGPNSASFGPRDTVLMAVEPAQPRRGRRGAVSGDHELSRSRGQPATSPADNTNIFAYSLNKKKQRKLQQAAIAAAGRSQAANLEYVGVESPGNGYHQPQYHQPQYQQQFQHQQQYPSPQYQQQYSSPAPSPNDAPRPTRSREPSIYTESFAF